MTLLLRPASVDAIAMCGVVSWGLALPWVIRPALRQAAPALQEVRATLRSSGFILGSALFAQAYVNTDILIVGATLGDQAAGLYKTALALATAAVPAIGVVSFVYVSRLRPIIETGDPIRIRRAVDRQILLNAGVGCAFLVAMIIALPWVIPFAFGPRARTAVLAATVLSAATVFNILSMAFSYTLLGLERDRTVFAVTGWAAAANVALCAALIPPFGIIGGACASLATHAAITATLAAATGRQLRAIDQDTASPNTA